MPWRTILKILTGLIVAVVLYLALAPHPPDPAGFPDKVNHMLAFAVITACVRLAWPRLGVMALWLMMVAFGGAIEIAQWLMPFGRDAEWLDWAADIVAASAALLALGLGGSILRRIA